MASPLLLLCAVFEVLLLCLKVEADTNSIDLSLGLIHEPSDVIAEKNRPLTVNCSAYSAKEYGPLTVTWHYQGAVINESRRQVLPNGSLYFHRVLHQRKNGESDAGEYRCMITNSIGSLSRTIKIFIADMSRRLIIEPQSGITVEEGDVARLSCQITAIPPPIYTWQKNKVNLPQNDDRFVTLRNSGILLIHQVKLSDAGNYRCIASSRSNRRRSAEITMKVEPATKKFRTPRILSSNKTVKVRPGEAAILECTASGYPLPQVTWSKSGAINSSRILTKRPGLLVFTQVFPSDSGEYTCTASNRNLMTNELQSVMQKFLLEVLVVPTFVKRPKSTSFQSVRTVRLDCEAVGQPTPEISWLKNGLPFPTNGRVKIKKSGGFVILQTVSNDSGIYQCVAENEAGVSYADARLKLNISRDQPDPPTGLTARSLSRTSLELSWNVSTSRNGLEIQAYTIHYAPTHGGDESQLVAVAPKQVIDQLKPYTNYTFYVRAFNGRSASDESESLIWTTGEDIPIAAPIVTLTSSSATTLKVTWDHLPPELARGKIVEYKIQWRKKNSASRNIQNVSGDVMEYTITGLSPSTKYEVRVMGATKLGYPHLADESWPWIQHTMPSEATDQVPLAPLMELNAINSSAIEISWSMPKDNKVTVDGYKITYFYDNLKPQGPITITNNESTNYVLNNLEPHTRYQIHFLAYNSHGNGRELVRYVQTLGSSAEVESPFNLEAEPKNSTTINVKWKNPVSLKNITYFTVRYNPVVGSNVNSSSVNYINSTSREVVITHLLPHMLYEFSVQSHSNDNVEGPFSNKVECKTSEDVPTAPLELNWTPLDTQSVRLTWKPPKMPNGVITNYYIMYDVSKEYFCQMDKWLTKEEKGTELFSIMTGLMSNTIYYVCLRAKTSAGLGQPSEIISLKIPTAPQRNQSSVQPMLKQDVDDPQLGIVVGVSIGVGCMILCACIVIFRNRCYPSNLEPLPRQYLEQRQMQNGYLLTERGTGTDSREMESFTPMLTHVSTNTQLDTKGGYPIMRYDGKENGYSHSILRNAYVISGRLKRNKQNMNITENPQHTTWYLTRNNYHNRESPLLNARVVDQDDDSLTSDASRNEDSGVQLAPSQETESFNQDSRSSSRGSDLAERNSASAVPETYAIGGSHDEATCQLPRSRSWDMPFKHFTPPS